MTVLTQSSEERNEHFAYCAFVKEKRFDVPSFYRG